MKFKVGDKVRVKSYEEIKKTLRGSVIDYSYNGEKRTLSFIEAMKSFCGNVYTILNISFNGNYGLENDEEEIWYFTDDWLEAVEEKPFYVSSFDENEADVKEAFLKEILSTSEAIENCAKCDCDECSESYDNCVIFKIRDAIRTYQKKWG